MNIIKQQLIELLDFYRYKLVNDKCTQEDMRTVYEAVSERVVSEATISDMARFYGQSESNVRNVIARKVTEKPKRRVTYNITAVMNALPKGWRTRG